MNVNIISACDLNGGIGKDNKLPWIMPSDLKFFKEKTINGVIVLGRKTFESLPGILPGRSHWVISKDEKKSENPNVLYFTSPEEVIEKAKSLNLNEIWISGGSTIYSQFMKYADNIFINQIQAKTNSDTFFPDFEDNMFILKSISIGESSEKDQYQYTKQHWIRSKR